MTAENSRPWQGAADANGDADNTSVEPSADKIGLSSVRAAPALSERMSISSAVLDMALALAADGFHVFPLDHPWWETCRGAHSPDRPCDGKRGKHPVCAWKDSATTNAQEISRMFSAGPFNIGIACGPSGLLVIDEDGPRDLAAYSADTGLAVPDTRRVQTGRGTHQLFKHDHAVRPHGNAEGLLSAYDINVRGAGGYIVGPGSTHQNGAVYEFLNPQTPIQPLPLSLLEAVLGRRPRQATSATEAEGVATSAHAGPIPQGKRHSAMVSYAGRLLNSGLSPKELRPVFLERFKDCVQPQGAVPGARYEQPGCTEVYSESEALAVLDDVVPRYQAGTAEEWRTNTPTALVRQRERQPFPLDALPQPLSAMVAAVAEFTQTDPAMAGTTAVAMVAAAAGGRVQVEVRPGWREPVNLYTATVAGPGERKSAVQAVMSAPLQDAEVALAAQVHAERLEAQLTKDVAAKAADIARTKAGKADPEGRADFLQDAIAAMQAADSVEVPVLPRLLADDITPERCAGLLAEQGGRLAVVSAEGGIFDIIGGRYSAGVPSLDVWLKGHSGDRLRIDRQSRETEFVAQPALTLCLMIQPSVLTNIARNQDFRGRGLLARFLYAVPDSKVGTRVIDVAPVPEEVSVEYGGLIRGLALDLSDWHDPAVLQLSPSAGEMLMEAARELEPRLGPDGELGHIADWGGKLIGAIARMAGLIHLAENPREWLRLPIDASSMGKALKLGDYYKSQALYAFEQMRADPAVADAEYLLSVVRRLDQPVVSRRDLHANASRSRFMKVTDLDIPIKLLEDHGYLLRQAPTATTGRGRSPSPTWAVHPAFREDDRGTR